MRKILISLLAILSISAHAKPIVKSYPSQLQELKEESQSIKDYLLRATTPKYHNNLNCQLLENNIKQLVLASKNIKHPEAEKDLEQIKKDLENIVLANNKIHLTCYQDEDKLKKYRQPIVD